MTPSEPNPATESWQTIDDQARANLAADETRVAEDEAALTTIESVPHTSTTSTSWTSPAPSPWTPPPTRVAAEGAPLPADTMQPAPARDTSEPWFTRTEQAVEKAVAHFCSNGHECTCTDIPNGGHACGRTPELEPDGPHAEELARLATAEKAKS